MAMLDIVHAGGTRTINGDEITKISVVRDPRDSRRPYSVHCSDGSTTLVDEVVRDQVIADAGLVVVEHDWYTEDARHVSGKLWLNPKWLLEIGDNDYEAKSQFPKWVRLKGETGTCNVTDQSAVELRRAADA